MIVHTGKMYSEQVSYIKAHYCFSVAAQARSLQQRIYASERVPLKSFIQLHTLLKFTCLSLDLTSLYVFLFTFACQKDDLSCY